MFVFLNRIYEDDNGFLSEEYRNNKKRLITDVQHTVSYFLDKESADAEISSVAKDMQNIGADVKESDLIPDFSGLDLYFMSMRLRILFFSTKPYERLKLRTLLKDYGYRRRTKELVSYLSLCMEFYEIQPFLKGGCACTLEEISLDDMITCRLEGGRKSESLF